MVLLNYHLKPSILYDNSYYLGGYPVNDYDVIVNTIPTAVIDQKMIDTIKDDALIVDVASFPYGLDHHYAINKKKNSYVLSSIPSRYAYKYAADMMFHVIEDEYNDL